jgi:hypothetical protein
MRIYIPSRGRHLTVQRQTLSRLHDDDLKRTTLVVHASEYDMYFRATPPELYTKGLRILSLDYDKFPDKKHKIGLHAAEQGESSFCVIDDDLQFLVRISDIDWRLRNQTKNDAKLMFEYISVLATVFGHGAISSREGNNRGGVGSMTDLTKTCARAMRFHFFQTELFLSLKQGRLIDVEDFDATLQLLRRGYPNAVNFWFASGQNKTNSAGGCSLYRTNEVHDQEVRKLQAFHPKFVSLRLKSNKTDNDGFGTRTEATIQWRKAYDSSKGIQTNDYTD